MKPLRWFVLPSEAYNCLHKENAPTPLNPFQLPFSPPNLLQRLGRSVPSSPTASAVQIIEEILQHMESSANVIDNDVIDVPPSQAKDSSISNFSNVEMSSRYIHKKPFGASGNVTAEDSNSAVMRKISPFADGMVSALEQGFVQLEDGHNEELLTNFELCNINIKEKRDDPLLRDTTMMQMLTSEDVLIDCENKNLSSTDINNANPSSVYKIDSVLDNISKDNFGKKVESGQVNLINSSSSDIINRFKKEKESEAVLINATNHLNVNPTNDTSEKLPHETNRHSSTANDGNGSISMCNKPAMLPSVTVKKKKESKWFSPPKAIFKNTVTVSKF